MINAINSTQNTNFNGRLLATAANHIKSNAGHYLYNGAAFTTAAMAGALNSTEHVIATKLFADALEASVFASSGPKCFASVEKPITNTCFLIYKNILNIIHKVI